MSTTTFSGPVQSLNGFTMPVLTSVEIGAITNPTTGLTVFNSDLQVLQAYNGSTWNPPL